MARSYGIEYRQGQGPEMNDKRIMFEQLFRYYKGLPHQAAAIQELEKDIEENGYDIAMRRDRNWFATWSQAGKQSDNSWSGVKRLAKESGVKFPECVAAQWALESGWGEHFSGRWNAFGLKGDGTEVETTEYVDGKCISMKDSFINFESLSDCIDYLVTRWYKNFKSYRGVNSARSREDCARDLISEGYATDPNYAEKLIRLMNENETSDLKEKILDVPYQYQLDNKSGTGYRECFSSTCAMIAQYYGKVSNDDAYNIIRNKFGDTTSAEAQINALRECGLKAHFITNGTAEMLEEEINNGRPVAVGWLHKGLALNPSGKGHWSCCVGYTSEAFVFQDPNGQADILNGGYKNNSQKSGKYVHYSRTYWLRRWECEGPGTGWAILVDVK